MQVELLYTLDILLPSMVFVGFKESFATENSWVLWHV